MVNHFKTGLVVAFLGVHSLVVPSLVLAEEITTLKYLKSLSIEELLQTEITSVSKKSESLFTAAAAVTVISQEDIERTGARSIPEALRMVPGLSVASMDGSRYAIGARGFNDFFETKLLVLIDGRSMYTPLYSGVHWNSLDTIMQDIDRIEVIKGPGATVWGANAVNGVINIITKKSQDTQGGMVSSMVGSFEQPNVSTRYGGKISDNTYYRLYAKGYNRDNLNSVNGGDAYDESDSFRGGFRVDNENGSNIISLQAEVYKADSDAEVIWKGFLPPDSPTIRGTEESTGGHILGLWEHRLSESSEMSFQMYYDRAERDRESVANETRDTIDLDFKYHWSGIKRHDVVWGAGYRWSEDDIDGTVYTSFDPDSRTDNLWSAFIQDDINVIEDFAWLTLGTKIEHNDYSGTEFQPSVRVRVQPDEKQLIWGAVSRAVRVPSRSDHDIVINQQLVPQPGVPGLVRVSGSDSFDSEELIAYELGYRCQVAPNLSIDIAAFYNDYDELRTFDGTTPYLTLDPVLAVVAPTEFANSGEGSSYGFEVQSSWQPTKEVKFIAGYSYIDLDLDLKSGTDAANSSMSPSYSPKHQVQLRNYWDFYDGFSLDSELYYVSELEEGDVDEYFKFDAQLSWQVTDALKLAIAGENLFSSARQEFVNHAGNVVVSKIPTQYWLKATYRF